MKMPTIFCISGHAQHGKDTVAAMMTETLTARGKRVLNIRYADLLKYFLRNYFDWDGKKDEHGRNLLQRVGTGIIRAQDPDYWVDFVIKFVRLMRNEYDCVVIPDTRFPNEIERWREEGFDVIHVRVVRPGFNNGLTYEQKNHPSETALDDYRSDFTIINRTMEELTENVNSVLETVGATAEFVPVEQNEFFKLLPSDTVYLRVGNYYYKSEVYSEPIWDSDADEPDWEVQTSNGCADMYSIYKKENNNG